MNVVYIEDDEMLREVFTLQFRRLFTSIEMFEDPEKALDYLSRAQTDVIFCDLWMPCMNGTQVYEKLRSSNNLTPFVLLTGEMNVQEILSEYSQRQLYVLEKPCHLRDMEELLRKIKTESETSNRDKG